MALMAILFLFVFFVYNGIEFMITSNNSLKEILCKIFFCIVNKS